VKLSRMVFDVFVGERKGREDLEGEEAHKDAGKARDRSDDEEQAQAQPTTCNHKPQTTTKSQPQHVCVRSNTYVLDLLTKHVRVR
jgi:hypothetical protein